MRTTPHIVRRKACTYPSVADAPSRARAGRASRTIDQDDLRKQACGIIALEKNFLQCLQHVLCLKRKATTGAEIIGSGVNGGGRRKSAEHPKGYNAEGLFPQQKP
jgi:hypothetical protein